MENNIRKYPIDFHGTVWVTREILQEQTYHIHVQLFDSLTQNGRHAIIIPPPIRSMGMVYLPTHEFLIKIHHSCILYWDVHGT